ncbi:hypothetical protein V8E54_005343 [Elaphomyces granulatus]
MATKHFGTRAILKKKDGNGPVHDEEAGSWTESKQKSPSQQIELPPSPSPPRIRGSSAKCLFLCFLSVNI